MKKTSYLIPVLMLALILMLTGCEREEKVEEEQIELTLFTNLTDRNVGQGYVEQCIIDEYMERHPNVSINVESLEEEAYKIRFKACEYDGMPDIFSVWGQPSFIKEVAEAGMLEPIDIDSISDYGFVSGALDGFTYNDNLYGLPRNTDLVGFYYNKKLFEENGWKIPKTYEELLCLCASIRKAGLIPISIDGADGWPLAVYYDNILLNLSGRRRAYVLDTAIESGDFEKDDLIKAMEVLNETVESAAFERQYENKDYGEAMGLFTSGQAVMFYSGSWDSSLAVDLNVPADIRNNIGVFLMPGFEGHNEEGYVMGWFGGGYSVSSSSQYKEVAMDFLLFMFRKDKLSKYGMENNLGMAAQNQSEYVTGKETSVMKTWMNYINNAGGTSGTPVNDRGSSRYKQCFEDNIGKASGGSMTFEEFDELLSESCR
ncbi:MAG: extracellular solute-binding protein [Lachnospiraceae bacterium]|nr:extracellular solute-binding protein [Lachnospiraceae bacterium]